MWTIFLALSLFFKKVPTENLNKSNAGKNDFEGVWVGKITRDEGGGQRAEFDMKLELKQNGKRVTGVSSITFQLNNKDYSAKMEITGKASGQFLRYIETRIITADSIPSTEWCMKKAELILKIQEGRPSLEGLWEGFTTGAKQCLPGRIFLQKPKPRV